MTRAEAKAGILQQWRSLPQGERTSLQIASFAIQAAKDYPFESANPCGVIRLWLLEDWNEHGSP